MHTLHLFTALLFCHAAHAAQQPKYKDISVTPTAMAGIAALGAVTYWGYRKYTRACRQQAFIDGATKKYEQVKMLAQQDRTLIDMQFGEKQETALHGAVRNKDSGMVKILLDLNASIAIKNKDGRTAGYLALVSGDEAVLKEFLDKNYLKEEKNQWDFEAAVYDANEGKADYHLNQGANVNVALNSQGQGTLLHELVHMKGREHVQMLLTLGVDYTIKNAKGQTAEDLLLGCENPRGKEVLNVLREHREKKEQSADSRIS